MNTTKAKIVLSESDMYLEVNGQRIENIKLTSMNWTNNPNWYWIVNGRPTLGIVEADFTASLLCPSKEDIRLDLK